MSTPAERAATGLDLSVLDPIADAVQSGAGLPEVLRAAARALDASLAISDRGGTILAVAARSPADERSLMSEVDGVEALELRVADEPVGTLRIRARTDPGVALLRLVCTLVASEVERLRAPDRASAAALGSFLRAVLSRDLSGREDIVARASELGVDLDSGATAVVVRVRALVPTDDGWRERVLAVADRGVRGANPAAVAALGVRGEGAVSGAEVTVVLPGGDEEAAARAAEALLRELQTALPGMAFAVARPPEGETSLSFVPWITTVGTRIRARSVDRSPEAMIAASWRPEPAGSCPRS